MKGVAVATAIGDPKQSKPLDLDDYSIRVDNKENSFRTTFTIGRYYVFTAYYGIEYQYLMYRINPDGLDLRVIFTELSIIQQQTVLN
ncbi:MAG: hypothetical protein WBP64_12585 [Nitrososphaeraceae archaeon]